MSEFRGAFVHVQKTGGTSVRKMFRGARVYESGHANAASLRERFMGDGYTQAEWDALFKFAFARNPWDRWLSLYRYRHGDPVRDGFREFVNRQERRDWGYSEMSFVGRFEHITEDTRRICDALDYRQVPVLHLNINKRGPTPIDWRPYYDDETRERVAEHGAWEIARFGYDFDDCAQRREVAA